MTATLKVYRQSALKSLAEGCLFRYKAIWLDGVEESSDLALVGTGLHKVKHRYIDALVDAGVSQDLDLARAAFIDGVGAAQSPARLIPEMRKLWDWHAEWFTLPIDQFVAAEERDETSGVSWAPDLVLAREGELEILDDKWGWAPPLTEDDLRENFQARVYSYNAMQRWPNFLRYRFTISANRFQKYVSVVFVPSDLDNVEREIAALVAVARDASDTGRYPALAGPSCRFCELACPLELPVVAPKRFLASSEAEKVGQFIRAGEQQIKVAKAALKGYVSAHGPVPCNGLEWNHRPTRSVSYPLQAVLDTLIKRNTMGAFDDPKITISASALSGLFKQFPQLAQDLADVATEKTGYRFTCGKPGAGADDSETD